MFFPLELHTQRKLFRNSFPIHASRERSSVVVKISGDMMPSFSFDFHTLLPYSAFQQLKEIFNGGCHAQRICEYRAYIHVARTSRKSQKRKIQRCYAVCNVFLPALPALLRSPIIFPPVLVYFDALLISIFPPRAEAAFGLLKYC